MRQRLGCRRLRRHDDHFAAAIDEHAQDVALYAEVVGDDPEPTVQRREGATVQIVTADIEPVVLRCADDFRQIHALQPRERTRRGDRPFIAHAGAGGDAAALRARIAQDARQPARIDAGDRDDIVTAQVGAKRFLRPPVAGEARHIANDEAGGMNRDPDSSSTALQPVLPMCG